MGRLERGDAGHRIDPNIMKDDPKAGCPATSSNRSSTSRLSVRRADEERETLPVASDEKRALSIARRRKR
jgi:hypothetical protein